MDLQLFIWRQDSTKPKGELESVKARGVSPDMSFLEMLDMVNEGLIKDGHLPIAFDHDCREGICGACSQVINGIPHGPQEKTTVCQLHMRHFQDGDVIYIEPFRARAFPVVKDLIVDRAALDRLIQSAGYVSVNTGGVPEANSILIGKADAGLAMDAAECIGCGACVAACPNGSAMLFTSARVSHLAVLPQGQPEAMARVCTMLETMDMEGFGSCSNHYECQAACPKGIGVRFIARLNREFIKALGHMIGSDTAL